MPLATDSMKPAELTLVAAVARVTLKSPRLSVLLGICEYNRPVLNRAGTIRRDGFGITVFEVILEEDSDSQ